MIFVIGGLKFNKGKIHTSVNFALYLANIKKRSVLLIDADPKTCSDDYLSWKNMVSPETELKLINLESTTLNEALEANESSFDDIVIDSGAGENLVNSIHSADRLIVPFSPEDLGLWTVWKLTRVETMIDNALDDNPELKAFSLMIDKDNNEEKVETLVKALKNSQYLDFMSSETLQDQMFAEAETKEPESVKSFISDRDMKIFDKISS